MLQEQNIPSNKAVKKTKGEGVHLPVGTSSNHFTPSPFFVPHHFYFSPESSWLQRPWEATNESSESSWPSLDSCIFLLLYSTWKYHACFTAKYLYQHTHTYTKYLILNFGVKKINLALQSVCFIRQKVEMLNDFKQFTYQTRNRVNLYWERGNTHFVIVVVTSKVTHHIRIPLLTITTNYMYITYSWTSNFFYQISWLPFWMETGMVLWVKIIL